MSVSLYFVFLVGADFFHVSVQIVKNEVVHESVRWRTEQKRGVTILQTISDDEEEVKRILGTSYSVIVGALGGTTEAEVLIDSIGPRDPHDVSDHDRNATTSQTRKRSGDLAEPAAKRRKLASPL